MTNSKADKKAAAIARYITKKLTEAGAYDPTLSYQVELVASDLLIYRKLRDACLDDEESVTFKEKSREGNSRTKVNPIFSELRRQSKIVQEGLDMLTMNIKSKKKKAETSDTIQELTRMMKEEEDDD
jgi:hypothetical protein